MWKNGLPYVMRLKSLLWKVVFKKKNIVAGKFFFWVRALSLPISKKPSLCHTIHSLTLRSTVLKEQKRTILSLGNRWNVTITESRDLTNHQLSIQDSWEEGQNFIVRKGDQENCSWFPTLWSKTRMSWFLLLIWIRWVCEGFTFIWFKIHYQFVQVCRLLTSRMSIKLQWIAFQENSIPPSPLLDLFI
jgi:hypothetical protein